MPNATIAPWPFGQVLLAPARATGSTSGPGTSTHSTSSRASSHCATASAFCECRSMRRLSVSSPWRNRNALNGEIAGADVALVLQPRLEDVLRGPQRLGQLREHEAVVARVGLGEVREAAAADVVELAAVDDDPADRRAVAADELRRRVHDDVGAVRAAAGRGTATRACCRSRAGCRCRARSSTTPSKSKMSPFGLPMRLAVERLGVRADRRLPRVEVVGVVDEADLDAELRERVVELVVGAAVERRATTRCGRRSRRGSAARSSARPARSPSRARRRRLRARSIALLEHGLGRVHDPRVDVAELLEPEEARPRARCRGTRTTWSGRSGRPGRRWSGRARRRRGPAGLETPARTWW